MAILTSPPSPRTLLPFTHSRPGRSVALEQLVINLI